MCQDIPLFSKKVWMNLKAGVPSVDSVENLMLYYLRNNAQSPDNLVNRDFSQEENERFQTRNRYA